MSLISFNKATEPGTYDDLRVNSAAVLYVEGSRPDLVGHTMLHMLGQGEVVLALTESVGTVVSQISGLVAANRHYLAAQPEGGPSVVYISPHTVSYVRPNLPVSPEFWYVQFVDGSEVRIADPLPAGL